MIDPKKATSGWFEIPVTDFERAKKFYENISGNPMTEMPAGPGHKMAAFSMDPEAQGSGAIMMGEGYEPSDKGVLVYLAINGKLSDAVKKVEESGGKVIMPHMQVGEYGFIALFMDTEGNRLGLHSKDE